jgi:hypothetical protein
MVHHWLPKQRASRLTPFLLLLLLAVGCGAAGSGMVRTGTSP